jgi:lipopolysaccharide transport system permease protein
MVTKTATGQQLQEINRPAAWWRAPFDVLATLGTHRFLISSFVMRDLRVRYRNSVLGYFWSLLEPLLLTLVYWVLFTVVAQRPENRYFLWVVVGALSYGYFTKCLTASVTSLTGNASMIKQIYFPREIFALATAASQLVIVMLSLLVTVPMMIYFDVRPSVHLLYLPAGLLLTAVFAVGVGLGCAALNAVHRDVEHFFKFVTKAGFYLSPVMWTLDLIPPSKSKYVDYLIYNPLTTIITMVRSGIECKPLDSRIGTEDILYTVGMCVGCFVVGTMFFKRFEPEVVKHI